MAYSYRALAYLQVIATRDYSAWTAGADPRSVKGGGDLRSRSTSKKKKKRRGGGANFGSNVKRSKGGRTPPFLDPPMDGDHQ